ncbi:MAG: hypothetical protein ACK4IK_03485 [Bacteroidia bacterium]
MRVIISILFITCIGSAYCQTGKRISKNEYEEVLSRSKRFFSEPVYSVNVVYKSYVGHKSNVVYDELKAKYYKNNKNAFFEIANQLTIEENDLKFIIDFEDKEITLANTTSEDELKFQEIIYGSAIEIATAIELNKQANGELIKISFPEDLPIEKYEVSTRKDGMIKNITIYYQEKVSCNPDDEKAAKDKLKLSIEFTDYKEGMLDDAKYKLSKYIQKINGKYKAVGQYSDFIIYDIRNIKI